MDLIEHEKVKYDWNEDENINHFYVYHCNLKTDKLKYQVFFIIPTDVYNEYKDKILDLKIDFNLPNREGYDSIFLLNMLTGRDIFYDHELDCYKIPIIALEDSYRNNLLGITISDWNSLNEDVYNRIKLQIFQSDIINYVSYYCNTNITIQGTNTFEIGYHNCNYFIFNVIDFEDESLEDVNLNRVIEIKKSENDSETYLSYTKIKEFYIIKIRNDQDLNFKEYVKYLASREYHRPHYPFNNGMIKITFENDFRDVDINLIRL